MICSSYRTVVLTDFAQKLMVIFFFCLCNNSNIVFESSKCTKYLFVVNNKKTKNMHFQNENSIDRRLRFRDFVVCCWLRNRLLSERVCLASMFVTNYLCCEERLRLVRAICSRLQLDIKRQRGGRCTCGCQIGACLPHLNHSILLLLEKKKMAERDLSWFSER